MSGKTAYAGARVSPGRHSDVSERNLPDLRPRRGGLSQPNACVWLGAKPQAAAQTQPPAPRSLFQTHGGISAEFIVS